MTETLPHLLSTSEFVSAVHALAPRVAVFDCDGTLWSGDAGSAFMQWTMDTGLLSPDRIARIKGRYEDYRRGQVSELSICGEMVQVYANLPEQALRAAAATFFRTHIEPNLFPELQQLIAALQRGGTDIWAVSSTIDWVIEEGVRRFGIPPNRVLAARVHVVDGLATDRLIDVPTDEGKVTALRRVGLPHPDAVFGNSVHDAAMLAIARQAFPVNPTPALLAHSAGAGWPVYFPAKTVPPRLEAD